MYGNVSVTRTIGSKIRIDGREYSHSEALQQLVERYVTIKRKEFNPMQLLMQVITFHLMSFRHTNIQKKYLVFTHA